MAWMAWMPAWAPVAVVLGACGGRAAVEKPAVTPPTPSSTPSSAVSTPVAAPAATAPSSVASSPPKPPVQAQTLTVAPPPSATSTKVTTRSDPAWATCYRSAQGRGNDPAKEVSAMANGCAKATKMKPVGTTIVGKQNDSGNPDSYPFKAEANHCYRVYAQGALAIKDLDLSIKDSTGAIAGENANDTASAVALGDGVVCFKEADSASVVVSVGMGGGAYALQIWGD